MVEAKRHRRVLVVDDDPNLPATILRYLRRIGGYETQAASGGAETLAILTTWRPDVVLLDVMMPGMNGYEVCRRIREDAANRFTKIILVSGKSDTPDRLAGYAAGADCFLSKPFDLEELIAKVRVFERLQRVEEMSEARNGLFTLFAHETRTPLTSILGAAQLLTGSAILGEDERDLTSIIIQEGERLQSLAAKTLMLYQLKGEPVLARLEASVSHRLVAAAERAAGHAQQREVSLEVAAEDDIRIAADWNMLDGALDELLANALHWSPPAGTVRLSVQSRNEYCRIQITDQGPGVKEEWRERVFDEFSVRDLMHHHRGTGLSLAIVRRVAELHGGVAAVGEAPGGGAAFTIDLPIATGGFHRAGGPRHVRC